VDYSEVGKGWEKGELERFERGGASLSGTNLRLAATKGAQAGKPVPPEYTDGRGGVKGGMRSAFPPYGLYQNGISSSEIVSALISFKESISSMISVTSGISLYFVLKIEMLL
jgi:hypothetical protein